MESLPLINQALMGENSIIINQIISMLKRCFF